MFKYILFGAAGFVCGSVMFSYWLPRLLQGIDITARSPDHNPGVYNVFRHAGRTMGILCLLLDLAKGAVPVWIAVQFVSYDNPLFSGVLFAPVLGHAITLFGKKGGKSIATSFGVLLGAVPHTFAVLVLAVWYLFFSAVYKIKSHRRRSICSYGAFTLTMLACLPFTGDYTALIGCAAISALVIYKHLLPDKKRRAVEAGAAEPEDQASRL